MRGRTTELARVTALLDHAADGPAGLFVEGEAGIGKTTLVDASAEGARERGFQVLRCRPSQAAVGLAHAGLLELLHETPADLVEGLPPAQGRALRVALRWDEPGPTGVEVQTIAAAVASVVRRTAETGPLLVLVDDLHWLDESSAQAMEFALRRVDDLPVAVLAAARTGEGPLPRPLERALPPGRVERLELGPLRMGELRDVVRERVGLELDGPLAKRVHASSRGNPLLGIEIGRAIAAQGVPAQGEHLPVPGDVRALVEARVGRLPAAARTALLEAASMSAPSVPTVRGAALRPAVSDGLVGITDGGSIVFAHPMIEAVVYASASAADRRAAHRRLATAVADPEERARHSALAADGPDANVADALDTASQAAAARGALLVACELSELAWRLTPEGDQDGPARGLRAAEFAMRGAAAADCRRLLDEVVPQLAGTDRGRAHRLRGEMLMWGGSLPDAVPELESALAFLDGDPAGQASVQLSLTFAHFNLGGDPHTLLSHLQAALGAAEASGQSGLLAQALAVRAMLMWLFGQGDDEAGLDRAAGLFDASLTVPVQLQPEHIRATLVGYNGRLAEGADRFQAQIDECRARGTSADIPHHAVHVAIFSVWAGRPDAAEAAVTEATRAADDLGGAYPRSMAMIGRLAIAGLAAAPDEVRKLAMRTVVRMQEGGSAYTYIWIAAMAGRFELSLGEYERAVGWFEPSLARGLPEALEPSTFFWLPDAIETYVILGRRSAAGSLLETFERRSYEMKRAWGQAASARCRALLLADDGQLDEAQAAAADAVKRFALTEHVIELGRAHLVLGQIERRRRQRLATREAFEQSARIFAAAGAVHWERRAAQELARSWSRDRDGGSLTPSEQQIAALAAAGRTNREIAAALFVSRRTVEATLSRVYRKLGVHSRNELVRTFPDPE